MNAAARAITLLCLSAALPAFAQHEGRVHAALQHEGHAQNTPQHEGHAQEAPPPASAGPAPAPPPASSAPASRGPTHAADTLFDPDVMAEARERLRAEDGGFRTGLFLADRFESRFGDGDESYAWDLQGWYGGDLQKVWLKSEGEGATGNNPDEAELEVLYSRAVTPFFDVQAGVRRDFRPDLETSHLVVGVQGLLPQLFDVDAAAFLSDEGDLTGRFEAEYDVRINQRLVLQPRVELDFAAQAIPERGVGSGVGSLEGGFRLRYEVRREIAPYVGVAWERRLGDTADFARSAGEDRRAWKIIVGVRAWF